MVNDFDMFMMLMVTIIKYVNLLFTTLAFILEIKNSLTFIS